MTSRDSWRSFAIVPAAGRSERMGRPKLLLPWHDRTVIEHTLDAWQSGGVTRIVIVVRSDDTQLLDIVRHSDALAVVPSVPPPEMKDSIRLALEQIARQFQPTNADAWLLAPADLVRLTPRLIDRLLAAYDPAHPMLVAPTAGGRRSHPVLLPWAVAAAVRELPPHEGVDALVNRCAVHEIPWPDNRIAEDLDTPADYARLLGESSPVRR
jgi:molybdenum cofactor cytidylyltransferase